MLAVLSFSVSVPLCSAILYAIRNKFAQWLRNEKRHLILSLGCRGGAQTFSEMGEGTEDEVFSGIYTIPGGTEEGEITYILCTMARSGKENLGLEEEKSDGVCSFFHQC